MLRHYIVFFPFFPTQEMAKHLKKDPESLSFSLEKEGSRLTGKEMMGDLEGARIVITRLY